jgi:hypothetical protein
MPAELKTMLQEKAGEAKRTLSAEAQLRLERSLHSAERPSLLPDTLQLAFGELGGILLMIGYLMERSGRLAAWNATQDIGVWRGDDWLANPVAYDAAVKAAQSLLEACRPPGKTEPSDPPFDPHTMIEKFLLGHPDDAPPYAAEIRRLFSEAMLERITRHK